VCTDTQKNLFQTHLQGIVLTLKAFFQVQMYESECDFVSGWSTLFPSQAGIGIIPSWVSRRLNPSTRRHWPTNGKEEDN